MRCQAYHSVFYMIEDGALIIVAVYVDDKMMLSKNKEKIEKLKKQLAHEYDMTDLGKARWILGMEIICDRDKRMIVLSQHQYIESIPECYNMVNCHSVITPINTNAKLTKLSEAETDIKEYQSAVRALMYTMLAT